MNLGDADSAEIKGFSGEANEDDRGPHEAIRVERGPSVCEIDVIVGGGTIHVLFVRTEVEACVSIGEEAKPIEFREITVEDDLLIF